MSEKKNCALVVRVSDPRQARSYKSTWDLQLSELRKEIEIKNMNTEGPEYVEYKVYDLKGVSGSVSFESDPFEELKLDILLGYVNVVICTALDRLGRDVAGFIDFFNFLKDKAELICTRLRLDTSTPTGEAIVIILMALAKLELDIKSERNRKSTRYRASEGLYNGGRPILGYDLNDDPTHRGNLIVNHDEAQIVRMVFQKYLELGSDSAVAKYFTDQNCINKEWIQKSTGELKGGGPITANVVKTILTNIKYIALCNYIEIDENTQEEVSKTRNAVWEPIIDEKLFYEVQEAREAAFREKTNVAVNTQGSNHFYLLKDVVVCSHCNEQMDRRSGKGKGGTYFNYVCKNDACPFSEEMPSGDRSRSHVDADEADSAAFDVINKILASDHYISELSKLVNKDMIEELPKRRGELRKLTKRARTTKKEIHRLSKALTAFNEDSEEYIINKKEVQRLSKVYSTIEVEKKRVKSLLDTLSGNRISEDQIRSLLENTRKLSEYGPQKQRRDLIKQLFRRVDVDEEKMVFHLHVNTLRYIHNMSTRNGGFEQIVNWRAERVSQRTILWLEVGAIESHKNSHKKHFRNPLILADELHTTMELEELTRAELARRLGYSRARITQLLNLLNLPQELQQEIRSMGDNWDRRLVTERGLRDKLCRNDQILKNSCFRIDNEIAILKIIRSS